MKKRAPAGKMSTLRGHVVITQVILLAFAGCLIPSSHADAAETLPNPEGRVILTVSGRIANTNAPGAARFDREMLEALGMTKIETTTPWTDGVPTFEGVLVRKLLKTVGATGEWTTVSAINDYSVEIPVSDFRDHEVVLAIKMNGKYMLKRNKGPLWIIYPWDDQEELKDEIIFHRSVWQVNEIFVK